jgi:hypothetical protein
LLPRNPGKTTKLYRDSSGTAGTITGDRLPISWKQTREFSQVIESLTGDRCRVTWYTGKPWKPSILYQDSSGTVGKITGDRLPISWKQTREFSQVIESLTRGPLPRNLVHR